jgi:hypothetical protein
LNGTLTGVAAIAVLVATAAAATRAGAKKNLRSGDRMVSSCF